uniref:Peptidase_M41 domain-containing protein n=1 Tax=Globodera pallida TaxID=36090 RepID=A0A183BXX1_GLOPA
MLFLRAPSKKKTETQPTTRLVTRSPRTSCQMACHDRAARQDVGHTSLRDNANYDEKLSERRNTAFHESSHAVAAYVLPNAMLVTRITIIPDGDDLGHTSVRAKPNQELADVICMAPAGGCSAKYFTDADPGCDRDNHVARSMARQLVLAKPRRRVLTEQEFAAAVETVLRNEKSRAERLISRNTGRVNRLAQALLARGTISADEMIRLIGPQPRRPIMVRLRGLLAKRCNRRITYADDFYCIN